MTSLKVGDQAPEFSLFDSAKNKVNLSDYKGKQNVLLLFFPLAFTGVCTTELCSVRDQIKKYDDANTVVFGISTDSFASLAKYKAEQNYQYQLLSDYNKEVSKSFNALYDSFTDMGMKGVSKRAAFVIDKQGTLQYAEVLENAGELPNFEAIQEKLGTL